MTSDRLPPSLKKTVTYHLDELPLTQICCHAKVAFYTQQPHKPKDLAPLKAVDTSNERLTPKLKQPVWRLMVNFNTPLATPTCHGKKTVAYPLEHESETKLTFSSLTHFMQRVNKRGG